MSPEEQQRHIDHLLPRVKEVRENRRPVRRLMICVVALPIVMLVVFLAALFFQKNDFKLIFGECGVLGLLICVGAWAFTYLGKMQACDDVLVRVDFAVIRGDDRGLEASMENLECMGRLDNAIRDALLITKKSRNSRGSRPPRPPRSPQPEETT